MTLYQLTGLLAEQMGRSVDAVGLSECRFRERIQHLALDLEGLRPAFLSQDQVA